MTLILSSLLSFPKFYDQIRKEKIPFALAYKLSKLKNDIDFHINFYQENLRKIVSECAQKDENGQMKTSSDGERVLLIPELTSECTRRIQELDNFEVTIPEYDLKIEDFDNITLELEYLEPIFPFLS